MKQIIMALFFVSVSSFGQSTNFRIINEGCKQCKPVCQSFQASVEEADTSEIGIVEVAKFDSLGIGASVMGSTELMRLHAGNGLGLIYVYLRIQVGGEVVEIRDFVVSDRRPIEMFKKQDKVVVAFKMGLPVGVIPFKLFSSSCVCVEDAKKGIRIQGIDSP